MNTFCRYILINSGPCNLDEEAGENNAPPARANCRVKQHFHEFCGGRSSNANYTHKHLHRHSYNNRTQTADRWSFCFLEYLNLLTGISFALWVTPLAPI